jgi:hypothetical protein
MALIHTFYKKNEDGTKTVIDLAERFAMLNIWLSKQDPIIAKAYETAHTRKEKMIAEYDLSTGNHAPVDPEWKMLWERFLTDSNLEHVITDAP